MKHNKRLTALLAGLLAVSMPVSYTHLDVYKRQVNGGVDGIAGGNDGVNGHDVREEGNQQVVVCQGAHNGDGNGTGKRCV